MIDTEADQPPLLSLMKEVVDALGTLIAGHLRLARAELGDEARRHIRRGAYVLLASVIVLMGWAFLCLAGAVALARFVGTAPALSLVGGVHLVGAALAFAMFLRRAPARAFDESISELDRTVTTLAVTASGLARSAGRDDVGAGEEGARHVIP